MYVQAFTALAGLIKAFLELKVLKEEHKYGDSFLELNEAHRQEIAKPIWDGVTQDTPGRFRNDARLAELFAQLCDLSVAIATAPRK